MSGRSAAPCTPSSCDTTCSQGNDERICPECWPAQEAQPRDPRGRARHPRHPRRTRGIGHGVGAVRSCRRPGRRYCSHETASNTHACNGVFNQTLQSGRRGHEPRTAGRPDRRAGRPVAQQRHCGGGRHRCRLGQRCLDLQPTPAPASTPAVLSAQWMSAVSMTSRSSTVAMRSPVTPPESTMSSPPTRSRSAATSAPTTSLDGTFALGYGTFEIGDEGVINADSINDGANGIVATAVNSLIDRQQQRHQRQRLRQRVRPRYL